MQISSARFCDRISFPPERRSGRRLLLLPVLAGTVALVSGCQKAADDPFTGSANDADKIECQVSGASALARVCMVERTAGPDGLILTIRHPDGGFRRLKVTKDGRGVIAADGAQPVAVSIAGDRQIDVAIGGDRYRLPATVKPGGPGGA